MMSDEISERTARYQRRCQEREERPPEQRVQKENLHSMYERIEKYRYRNCVILPLKKISILFHCETF